MKRRNKEMYTYFKYYLSILFYLLFIKVSAQSLERDWCDDRRKVKIISYNVMNGFNELSDKDRILRFTDWVSKINPDIIALNELCGFDKQKLQEFASLYNHLNVALLKEDGYPVGITSKYPIEIIARKLDGFGHGLMHCKILDIDFLITHLNPFSIEKRKQEATNIVKYIKECNLENCILMGDMNSKSPFDISWPYKNHEEFSVISIFISSFFYDLCYSYVDMEDRFTFPTRILPTSPKGSVLRNEQERIDFIFGTKNISDLCVDAEIYNREENDYLSDHYPVGVDLLLPLKKIK